MTEPMSVILVSGVVSGAAGALVKQTVESGSKWLLSKFHDHGPKSVESMKVNANRFLSILENRVIKLEQEKKLNEEIVNNAFKHPDFTLMLQKAIISAAETSDGRKHYILSRLIEERMKGTDDSLISMISKQTVELIPYLNSNQFALLGFITLVGFLQPSEELNEDKSNDWIERQIKSYLDVKITQFELLHLVSVGCIKTTEIVSVDILDTLSKKKNLPINIELFAKSTFGVMISDIWKENNLNRVMLTSTGIMIGIMTNDLLNSIDTDLTEFK